MSAYTPRPTNTSNGCVMVHTAMRGTVPTNTANVTHSPTRRNVGNSNSATAFLTIQRLAELSGPTVDTSTPTIVPSSFNPSIISPTFSTLRDHLIKFTFQIVGITTAMVFGVWCIKSYSTSVTANYLSSQ
ncbi:hypothetical protein B0H16DRAFT_1879824 [Mycena metata]|uniref:Uncharacterized protein n=1 Tax=Mycena metata TaxID=1033252 RepID=A0AAD7JZX1_9AGAR|nr:hypothetical protein B0H16DRAFT_1879824 [Mycena metata]